MNRISLTETSLSGLRTVGIGGRRTLDSWDQIDSYLRSHPELGDRAADLFAEPVLGDDGSVEWYVDGGTQEPPTPISRLEPARQEALKAEAAALIDGIGKEAERLKASADQRDVRLGHMLASALLVPSGRDLLYAVGGRPVLVTWGMLDDGAETPTGILQAYLAPRPVAPIPLAATGTAPAAVATGTPWWGHLWWLVFATLVAAILYWLLLGCAVGLPSGPAFLRFCPVPPADASDALRAARDQEDDLRAELERMEDALNRVSRCALPPPPPAPPPPPEPIPEPIPEPDPPPPEPEPEPEPPPPPPPPPPPEPEPPEDAFDERLDDAGGTDGETQVTLIWDGDDDLDLRVVCPNGRDISFSNFSACGGQLDIDANGGSDRQTSPVENIYWPEGSAPPGTYQVYVDNFEGRGSGNNPVPFEVRVRRGDRSDVYSGQVAPPGPGVPVTTFTLP